MPCVVSVVRSGGSVGAADHGHELIAQSMRNKQELCDACGFRCILDHNKGAFGTHGRHPSWDKVVALQYALSQPECNVTVWSDADVIFYRPFRLPSALFSAQTPVAAGRDVGGLNSGLMWFARSAVSDELLQRVWREEWFNGDFGGGSRDQAAFHHVLRHRQTQVTMLENVVRYNRRAEPTLSDRAYHLTRVPSARRRYAQYLTGAQKRNHSLYRHAPAYHHAGCSLFRKHASQSYAPPSFCAGFGNKKDRGAVSLAEDKPGAVSCCQRHFSDQLRIAARTFARSRSGGGDGGKCPEVPLPLLAPRQMTNKDTHLTTRQRKALKHFYRLDAPALAEALALQRRAPHTIPGSMTRATRAQRERRANEPASARAALDDGDANPYEKQAGGRLH
jgi:hypothetical protein